MNGTWCLDYRNGKGERYLRAFSSFPALIAALPVIASSEGLPQKPFAFYRSPEKIAEKRF